MSPVWPGAIENKREKNCRVKRLHFLFSGIPLETAGVSLRSEGWRTGLSSPDSGLGPRASGLPFSQAGRGTNAPTRLLWM
jgi:hypothetical protein